MPPSATTHLDVIRVLVSDTVLVLISISRVVMLHVRQFLYGPDLFPLELRIGSLHLGHSGVCVGRAVAVIFASSDPLSVAVAYFG